MADKEEPHNEWKEKFQHIPSDRESLRKMLYGDEEHDSSETPPVANEEDRLTTQPVPVSLKPLDKDLTKHIEASIVESTSTGTPIGRREAKAKTEAYLGHGAPEHTVFTALKKFQSYGEIVRESNLEKIKREADALRDKKQGKQ